MRCFYKKIYKVLTLFKQNRNICNNQIFKKDLTMIIKMSQENQNKAKISSQKVRSAKKKNQCQEKNHIQFKIKLTLKKGIQIMRTI